MQNILLFYGGLYFIFLFALLEVKDYLTRLCDFRYAVSSPEGVPSLPEGFH